MKRGSHGNAACAAKALQEGEGGSGGGSIGRGVGYVPPIIQDGRSCRHGTAYTETCRECVKEERE